MKSGKWRHLLYLAGTLAMLAYAFPRLELGQPWTASTVFGAAWTAFALLVAAANAWALADWNERTKRRLEQVKRAKAISRQRLADRVLTASARRFKG